MRIWSCTWTARRRSKPGSRARERGASPRIAPWLRPRSVLDRDTRLFELTWCGSRRSGAQGRLRQAYFPARSSCKSRLRSRPFGRLQASCALRAAVGVRIAGDGRPERGVLSPFCLCLFRDQAPCCPDDQASPSDSAAGVDLRQRARATMSKESRTSRGCRTPTAAGRATTAGRCSSCRCTWRSATRRAASRRRAATG